MKVKVFSARADKWFRAIRIGDESHRMSANEKLESDIQAFPDENPGIEIKHLQFSSLGLVPKTASWETTNSEIDWEIEKSVLIIYDGGV